MSKKVENFHRNFLTKILSYTNILHPSKQIITDVSRIDTILDFWIPGVIIIISKIFYNFSKTSHHKNLDKNLIVSFNRFDKTPIQRLRYYNLNNFDSRSNEFLSPKSDKIWTKIWSFRPIKKTPIQRFRYYNRFDSRNNEYLNPRSERSYIFLIFYYSLDYKLFGWSALHTSRLDPVSNSNFCPDLSTRPVTLPRHVNKTLHPWNDRHEDSPLSVDSLESEVREIN